MMILSMLLVLLQDEREAKLDALRPRLASEDAQERSRAADELKKMIDRQWRPALRKQIAKEEDPEVKSAYQSALDSLPELEMTIKLDGEAKVGQTPKFTVRIKNGGDAEKIVVRSLDGSDASMRYPRYLVRFFGPDGKEIPNPPMPRCGNCNELGPKDLVTLKPDEEMDPFGEGSFGQAYLQSFVPAQAGKYRVELTADFNPPDLSHYNGRLERGGPIEEKLKSVPKTKLEAKAEFEVKP